MKITKSSVARSLQNCIGVSPTRFLLLAGREVASVGAVDGDDGRRYVVTSAFKRGAFRVESVSRDAAVDRFVAWLTPQLSVEDLVSAAPRIEAPAPWDDADLPNLDLLRGDGWVGVALRSRGSSDPRGSKPATGARA